MDAKTTRRALYFGCIDRPGHYLFDENRRHLWSRYPEGFPWNDSHMDTGLLKNGGHPDVCDGKVFWTCGGDPLWYAFVWWDRSVDKRGACNSGFYVRGFDHNQPAKAFAHACATFPDVVKRQRHSLVLQ